MKNSSISKTYHFEVNPRPNKPSNIFDLRHRFPLSTNWTANLRCVSTLFVSPLLSNHIPARSAIEAAPTTRERAHWDEDNKQTLSLSQPNDPFQTTFTRKWPFQTHLNYRNDHTAFSSIEVSTWLSSLFHTRQGCFCKISVLIRRIRNPSIQSAPSDTNTFSESVLIVPQWDYRDWRTLLCCTADFFLRPRQRLRAFSTFYVSLKGK